MLPTEIKTPTDLMSVALQAEREAIQQYSELARLMHKAGNQDTAALFDHMMKEEQEHERLLLQWLQQEGVKINNDIGPVRWQDPNVDTTYNDEARSPELSTPYKALAFAVHNEDNAFRFYTRVAAETTDPKVREYAEVLAQEELGHAALLRAERRRAYHEERRNNTAEPALDPGMLHNEADILLIALCFDRLLAEKLENLDTSTETLRALADNTRRQIHGDEQALKAAQDRNILPTEAFSDSLEQLSRYNSQQINQLTHTAEKLQHLHNCCERIFAFYDSVVATTTDEQVMLKAQNLTASTLDRIGILKQALRDL